MVVKMISAQHLSNNGKKKEKKNTLWHVIVLNPANKNLSRIKALKLTPREKIELEVVHVSLKRDISLQLKTQQHTL